MCVSVYVHCSTFSVYISIAITLLNNNTACVNSCNTISVSVYSNLVAFISNDVSSMHFHSS